MRPLWLEDLCLKCGACVGTCPAHAIKLRETGISIDDNICTGCGTCVRICPVGSIEEVAG